MPIKRIQFPDGSIKRVEVPEGATDQQILDFVQSSYKPQPKADFSQVSENSGSSAAVGAGRKPARQYASGAGLSLGHVDSMGAPTLEQVNAENAKRTPEDRRRAQLSGRRASFEQMNPLTRFVYGAGRAVDKTVRGIGQLAHDAGDAVLGGDMGARMRAEETQRRKDEAVVTDGYAADDVGEFAGNVALWAAPASKVAGLNTVAGRVGGNLGLGAGIGALAPVQEGESRLKNAGIGAVASVVGQGAGKGLTMLGNRAANAISPEARALAAKAKSLGIRITPAQLSDSTALKTMRSVVGRMPFSGANRLQNTQREQFNRAVSRTFGEDSPVVNSDVYDAAMRRIGADFNRLSAQNNLAVDDALMARLAQVEQDAAETANTEVIAAVRGQIDKLLKASQNGIVPGRAYQSFDSTIGQLMKHGGEKAHYLGGIRSAVRDGMDASISPADRAAWMEARRQWGNAKTVRDLVSKETGEGISPAALMGRVNANGAGKEQMARGNRGELGDLAKIGQRFIKDPVPNSGTPERMTMLAALTGGGAMFGGPQGAAMALGTSPIARAMLDSPTLLRYMLRENPGSLRLLMGKQLPFLGLGAVPVAAQAYDP